MLYWPFRQAAIRDAVDAASNVLQRGDINAAVGILRTNLGGDKGAFRDAILSLLDHPSFPGELRKGLIEQALVQQPDFNLDAHDKEGRKALDLALDAAVRHDDQDFARYLLDKGANPERTPLLDAADGMKSLLTRRRLQNLLYAHHNAQDRQNWTDLDRDLQAGRYGEARARLDSLIAKNKEDRPWQLAELRARADGQKDMLRALLIVGRPDEFRQLKPRATGRWIDAFREDPGLFAALKELPYQSARKPHRELNGQAVFAGTGKPIWCRHLATYHQDQQAQDRWRIKFNYDQFSTTEAITTHVHPAVQWRHMYLKEQASETHLIDNRKFGQFLANQFTGMEKNKEPTSLMLVESINHAMNLGLRIKTDKQGKKAYVVKFFDPNITTAGTRSKARNPQTFEMQTIGSYLTEEMHLRAYYPPPTKGLSCIFVRPGRTARTSDTRSHAGRTLTTCIAPEDMDGTAVWHLMANGFAGNLRQLRNYFGTLPQEKRIELLSGKSDRGLSALYMATFRGHADAVTEYGELLNQCEPISEAQRIELLVGKSTTGDPAFFGSMHKGTSAAFSAYCNLLKSLSADKRTELLMTRNNQKNGVHIAIEEYQFEMIVQYLKILEGLAPDLSAHKRAWLRKELQDHEQLILNPAIDRGQLFHYAEYKKIKNEMEGTFNRLQKTLADGVSERH